MLCKRCSRKLKTKKSIELGYGSVCAKKHKVEPNVKGLEEWFNND